MNESRRPAFFPIGDYPELNRVRSRWRDIREEGLSLLPDMMWVDDNRTAGVLASAPECSKRETVRLSGTSYQR